MFPSVPQGVVDYAPGLGRSDRGLAVATRRANTSGNVPRAVGCGVPLTFGALVVSASFIWRWPHVDVLVSKASPQAALCGRTEHQVAGGCRPLIRR